MKEAYDNMLSLDVYLQRNTKGIPNIFTSLQVKIKCSLFSTSVLQVQQNVVISCFHLLRNRLLHRRLFNNL